MTISAFQPPGWEPPYFHDDAIAGYRLVTQADVERWQEIEAALAHVVETVNTAYSRFFAKGLPVSDCLPQASYLEKLAHTVIGANDRPESDNAAQELAEAVLAATRWHEREQAKIKRGNRS